MHRERIVRVIAVFLAVCCFTIGQIAIAEDFNSNRIAEIMNDFAFEMYDAAVTGVDNILFSPLSVFSAFALVYGGAAGETEIQLADAFGFALPQQDFHNDMKAFLSYLVDEDSDSDSSPLRIANALWVAQGYTLKSEYTELAQDGYGATIQELDFFYGADSAMETINSWCAEHTEGLISQLYTEPVPRDTRLLLTNAVYFFDKWAYPFAPDATQDRFFRNLDGSIKIVPMMWQREHLRYAETEDLQLIELPYASDLYSMFIILPRFGQFNAIQSCLSRDWLASITARLQRTEVILQIPRFEAEVEINLIGVLREMGLYGPFDPQRANFSGIVSERLFIDDAVHKAVIKVNEESTEAAAVTGITMIPVSYSPIPDPVQFYADRPFIYLIQHVASQSIVFVGRMATL